MEGEGEGVDSVAVGEMIHSVAVGEMIRSVAVGVMIHFVEGGEETHSVVEGEITRSVAVGVTGEVLNRIIEAVEEGRGNGREVKTEVVKSDVEEVNDALCVRNLIAWDWKSRAYLACAKCMLTNAHAYTQFWVTCLRSIVRV